MLDIIIWQVRKFMNEKKIGMLVYPVLSDPYDREIQLFSKGVFFTDEADGWEYQEKMNQNDDNKYAYWTNNIIPYDLKVDL